MNNVDDILKQILLNMNYDSGKTLLENKNLVKNNNLPKKKKITEQGSKPQTSTDEMNMLVTYQSVEPGQYITVPMMKYSLNVTEWHNTKEEYVEGRYDKLFKKKCETIAGLNPKYTLGEKPETDYYVDGKGDRCKSNGLKYWVMWNNNFDNVYSYRQKWEYKSGSNAQKDPTLVGYFYKEKGKEDIPSNWIQATGKTLEAIKTKVDFETKRGFGISGYPSNCKPLDYEVCMRWSARALALSGVEGGVKKFSMQDPKDKEKFTKYAVCVQVGGLGDENRIPFPWYSRYHNFYDTAQTETQVIDGEEKRVCKGLKDVIQIPDFKIGDNPVGSKSKNQLDDLKAKEMEAVSSYEDMKMRKSVQTKVESRLDNEFQTYKTGAIVLGK